MRNRFLVWVLALGCAVQLIGLPSVVRAADNLVPNPSVESVNLAGQPSDWLKSSWGVNQASFLYKSVGHSSTHSVEVRMQSYTSGDAKWYFEPQAILPNHTYSFSDYYLANVDTRVVAAIELSGGTTQYVELAGAPASGLWTRYATLVSTPADAERMTIFHMIDRVGYLRTDDFNLSMVASGFESGLVSLTFDDGWSSHYSEVLPILNQYNVRATFAIPTGFIGAEGRVTYPQLDAISYGNEISSHTVNHFDLTTLSNSKLKSELLNSRRTLELRYGVIPGLMLPYGAYNSQVMRQVRTYYKYARTSDAGFNTWANYNRYAIRTQSVEVDTTPEQVEAWAAQAAADRSWLVLIYHQVDDSGAAYGTTPDDLRAHLSSISALGLQVVPVDVALSTLDAQR